MIRFSKIQHNVRELFQLLTDFFKSSAEVEFAYIIGSYGRVKETCLSDVDIAVYLNANVSRDQYFDHRLDLINEIAHILRTNEIDVLILNQVGITK